MRIAESVVRFFPYIGGVEMTVHQLGKRLVKRGHDVRVVCADEGGDETSVDGMDVVRLPYYGKIANTNLTPGILPAIAEFEPDILHTHIPTVWFSEWTARASSILRKPMVLTYHNDIFGKGLKGVLAYLYNRFFLNHTLKMADRIVVSHEEYADYSKLLAPFRDKVTAITWGVEIDRFTPAPLPPSDELRLSFLSIMDRQHGYKGMPHLLQAISRLKSRGMKVRLEVGGRGELLSSYREMVKELGIEDRVVFHGFIPDEELPVFYQNSHLFVLPSTDARQEGFGLVLLEAMASGRAVLTTSIVGVAADIRRHSAGILVAPDDPEELTDALMNISSDFHRLREMGESARKLVETSYSWERVTDDYEKLFKSLLKQEE